MKQPRTIVANYTRLTLAVAYCAVYFCAASGCWREVEYTPPAGESQAAEKAGTGDDSAENSAAVGDATPAVTPPNGEPAPAGGFGEDLEKSLAAEEPAAIVDPADTTPIPNGEGSSAAVVSDRYAAKAPTTAADSLFESDEDPTPTSPPGSDSPQSAQPTEPVDESPAGPDSLDSIFGESDAEEPVPGGVDDSMLPEEREAIAEMSDEPIADLDDDDIPSPPPTPLQNSRRAVWLLGSKLSLAALSNDHGAAAGEVEKLFGQSRTLAEVLEVPLGELPARAATAGGATGGDPGLNYLFQQGQEIGRTLQNRFGPDHAALFEIAVKSNILLVIYQPGAATAEAIAAAIGRAGPRSGLPAEMWQPLLDTLKSRADAASLRKVVFTLHADADRYLATQAAP